jgi:hypothetical protein
MAEPFDPIATWQKLVSDWERQINDISARVTGTEDYSRFMNQATKFQTAARQQFDRQMEEFLKTVHLPSKADMTAIHDRLAAIEDAIVQLRAAIEKDKPRPAAPVTRNRRPPRPE